MANFSNPLMVDPSRTQSLRNRFSKDIEKRFNFISRMIYRLISQEDALGSKPIKSPFTFNTRWSFLSGEKKVDFFEQWIISVMTDVFEAQGVKWGAKTDWWSEYINYAFRQGAGRTFDENKKKHSAKNKQSPSWYQGTRDQFLSSAFNTPVAAERLKILAGRTYKDLKGVRTKAAQDLTRLLTDGLVQQKSAFQIAKDLQKQLKISKNRAITIARTEIIRAHAEGQLNALEALGVEEVAVNVEWQIARDGRVCPKCKALAGKVFKVKDAHGLIPVHPNCRCAFVPAFTPPDMTVAKARKRIESSLLSSKRRSKG